MPKHTTLPDDILLDIFPLLPQPTFFACLFVCRHWHNLGLPILYHAPQFPTKKSVTLFLAECTKPRSTIKLKWVRKLAFPKMQHEAAIWKLIKLCGIRLVRLDLSKVDMLGPEQIEVVEESCPNLIALNLDNGLFITDQDIESLFRNCRKLSRLSTCCSLLTPATLCIIAHKQPRMQAVRFGHLGTMLGGWLSSTFFDTIITLATACQNLRDLDISDVAISPIHPDLPRFAFWDCLFPVLQACHRLDSLAIYAGNLPVTEDGKFSAVSGILRRIHVAAPELRYLYLHVPGGGENAKVENWVWREIESKGQLRRDMFGFGIFRYRCVV